MTDGATDSRPSECSPRELFLIAAAAIVIRIALFTATCVVHDLTPEQFARLRDGESYLGLARAMGGDSAGLSRFDWRLFPGYPAAIALLRMVVPSYAWCALLISWLAAAAAAVFSAKCFRDLRVGWGMVALLPSHLLFTSMAMSESLMLALAVIALTVSSSRPAAGGAIGAAATFVRPQAIFLYVARALTVPSFVRFAMGGGVVAAAGLWLYGSWTGDILLPWRVYSSDVRAYGGDASVFSFPFASMILTPFRLSVPIWKILYSWAHVVGAITGCWLAIIAVRRTGGGQETDRTAAAWLVGNTLFVTIIGGVWGFVEVARFILPALPPLLYAVRQWLPRRRRAWIAVAMLCFIAALSAAGQGAARARSRTEAQQGEIATAAAVPRG